MYTEVQIKVDKRTAQNKHGVPLKQWRKWSALARKVFNDVFSTMAKNRTLFLHPAQLKAGVAHKHWKTTAWNAAWTAADATK